MPDDRESLERELKLNQVYLAIISRYKEYIEEKENISVAELPTLVMPKSEPVVKKSETIKNEFGNYNYKENFYEASVKAFHHIKENIEDIAMPLQFWLTPEETLSFALGDIFDRNVLLASILINLGNPSTKVLVSTREGARKVLTYYEFGGNFYVFDLNNTVKEYKTKDEIIKSLNIDEDTTSYEFNDKMYIDIS